jgi:hypothetical protein
MDSNNLKFLIEIISLYQYMGFHFQKMNFGDLIQNEMYYVKNNNFIVGSFIFIEYKGIHYPSAYCRLPGSQSTCYLSIKYNYFKIITPEEYKMKLKEKYDHTCLNIILKRLIDESFSWL